jgi:hypothetical protein
MIKFLRKLALFRVKNGKFWQFFCKNILKIMTSVPDHHEWQLLFSTAATPEPFNLMRTVCSHAVFSRHFFPPHFNRFFWREMLIVCCCQDFWFARLERGQ